MRKHYLTFFNAEVILLPHVTIHTVSDKSFRHYNIRQKETEIQKLNLPPDSVQVCVFIKFISSSWQHYVYKIVR